MSNHEAVSAQHQVSSTMLSRIPDPPDLSQTTYNSRDQILNSTAAHHLGEKRRGCMDAILLGAEELQQVHTASSHYSC